MDKEYQSVRWSARSVQVLLSLSPAREGHGETLLPKKQGEFAVPPITRLSRRSFLQALVDLEEAGLVAIIPYPPSTPQATQVSRPQEDIHEETTKLVTPAPALVSARPLLHEADQEVTANVSPQGDVIDQCRQADESGDRRKQVAALQAVWDAVFPEGEYPTQRLTIAAAKGFLRGGRSAEEVGELIIERTTAERRRRPVLSPKAFIEKVLEGEDRKSHQPPGDEGLVITDKLRALTELGRKQFGG